MLTRILVALAAILAMVTQPISVARAAPVECPGGYLNIQTQTCVISIVAPGTPRGQADSGQPDVVDQGGSVSACTNSSFGANEPVPCEADGGYWSNEKQCYVKLADPQPPKDNPVWQGRTTGAIYGCTVGAGGAAWPSASVWSDSAPAGPAAPVDPAAVAQTIVTQIELRAITIGMVPEEFAGSMGVVGLPVWMWVDTPSEQTYGPMTRSASLGGVTVTATATVSKVLWEMGDGGVVTCTTSGTPFTQGHGGQSSPDCGYTYARQGTYTVRATSYWSVDWTSNTGVSGSIPLQFGQSRIVQIGEIQVVRG